MAWLAPLTQREHFCMVNTCCITPLVSPYFSKDPIYSSPLATSPQLCTLNAGREVAKNTCSLFHVITCTLFLESREPLCSTQRGASGPHDPPSLHQGQSGHSTWRMGSRMRTQCRCQAAEGLPSLCLSPRKLKQKLARLTYLWLMGVAGELLKGQFVQREKQKLIFQLTDKTEKQERSTRGCLKWTWNSYWLGFGLFFHKTESLEEKYLSWRMYFSFFMSF